MTKRCTKCNQDKPADTDHFAKKPQTRDGLATECKDCVKERRELKGKPKPDEWLNVWIG